MYNVGVAQTVTYKGRRITAQAIPVPDSEEGEWAAQASVRIPYPSGEREQALHDPDDRTFATAEDAEGYALQLAIQWVDRHAP